MRMELKMRYGPTPENMQLIDAKAKKKNDGVYRFRGVVFRVCGNRVTHIAHNGKILERCGYFNVEISKYDGYQDEAYKALKTLYTEYLHNGNLPRLNMNLGKLE
jgi:hypothetical protein